MDAPPKPDPEALQELEPFLQWPPPGLERVQGDLVHVASEFFIGGAALVLPLLWVVTTPQPFYSPGPLGDAWWIVVVSSILGFLVLASAFTDVFRLLRRAARAVDTYGLRTILLTAADRQRDMGFVIMGRRAYSVLKPDERRRLANHRAMTALAYAAASAWLVLGFALTIFLASRGIVSPPQAALFTLGPVGVCLGVAMLFWLAQRHVTRTARRVWYSFAWSPDAEKEEKARWAEHLVESGGPEVRGGGSGFGLRLAAALTLVAAILVTIPAIVLVAGTSLTTVMAMVAVPSFSVTHRRAAEAEPLRRYAYVVEGEDPLTPAEAGLLLSRIARAGEREDPPPPELPVDSGFEDPFITEGERDENPTGVPPDRWPSELFGTMGSQSAEGVTYLRRVAAHPGLDAFSRLAGAAAADVASARWEDPLPEGMTAPELPIPRLSQLRYAVSAQVARAYVATLDGRRSEAETLLRQIVSFGLLLGDEGPTLIDNLLGYSMAKRGGDALQSFYAATGRTREAEVLAWGVTSAEQAARSANIGSRPSSLEALREMPGLVNDTTLPRGLRWELFILVNTAAPCINLNRMVFGPDPDYAAWLDEAHASLVRYPSEESLFELLRGGWFGRVGQEPSTGWIGRLVALVLGGGGTPGSCAQIFQSLSAAGVL